MPDSEDVSETEKVGRTVPPLDPRRAVYAGSFDPATLGHADILDRTRRLFDHVTVGVGINPEKRPLFEPHERVEILRRIAEPWDNVTVESFEGLTVDYVRRCGAGILVRGVRTVSDIEHESVLTLANRMLAPEVETIFLMASERYAHISSTLIKQIASMGGEGVRDQLAEFVPQEVIDPLLRRLRGSVGRFDERDE